MMYTLTLTGEQVHAVRLALAAEIDEGSGPPNYQMWIREAYDAIAEQSHAQHVAQRDAREGK